MPARRIPTEWLSRLILVLAVALIPAAPAAAQTMSIIATVNNAPISQYDLRARLELVIAMSGLPRTQQTAQELAPKVLESLIDEELKRQQAKALGITVTDAEVENAVHRMERARNLPPGYVENMLSQMHLTKDVLFQEIRADIGWSRAVRERFRVLTQISDADVDEEVARLEADKGKPVVLLSEIFLPVDTPKKDGEIQRVANRLVAELNKGTSFGALAATFSQSPTAAVGGDQGWVSLDSLSPRVQQALAGLKPGSYTAPIRTSQGYVIYWYRDKRVSQGASGPAVDPSVELQQVNIPVSDAAAADEQSAKMELAKRLRLRAKDCKAMAQMPKLVSGGLTASQTRVRLSQLAPAVRDAVKDLADKQVSEPLKVPGAIMLFMICSREQQNSVAFMRHQIRERLIADRLDLAARQYLRDLKRNAFIERR